MTRMKTAGIQLAAYANVLDMAPYQSVGGYQTDDNMLEVDLKRLGGDFSSFAGEFVRAGATMVGGCCGSNPNDISQIKQLLKN